MSAGENPGYVVGAGGEMLPVEDLDGSQVETWTRAEVNEEYSRLRNRYNIEPERALKIAVKRIQEVTSAVAEDEGRMIADGGYRQIRLES